MAKNLLIVESPAKAKTIEKILGSDFQVKSCYGHIRDLAKEDMGIDVKNGYQPKYQVSEDKEKVVSELRSLAKKSDEVWLATDEDREGEAISWHLCEVLGLDPLTTKRIVFHEITKPAIQKAVQTPRTVNMDLVNAQQARRVLDRLVGFEISPVLWRKVQPSLSAGRVQSVAVRLLVEREREIIHFKPISSYKVEAFFAAPDLNGRTVGFKAEGPERMKDGEAARALLERCIGASYSVQDVQVKPGKRSPAAPFTTSTLQQEASRKLGYSVSRTMRVAQTLYENGHITYMRTDSVNLSDTALEGARRAVSEQFGQQYHQQRRFKNKNESAQEAHEAIRPTDMMVQRIPDADGQRLYELIWKRTMASQMADAQLERTIAKIGISTVPQEVLTAVGEVVRFDGFLRVYTEGRDDEDGDDGVEGVLPPLKAGQRLDLNELRATERYTRALPRYTEASLVKKLEELGIGRPSTYAPTISTIQQRGYVERRDKEGIPRTFGVLSLKGDNIEQVTEREIVGAEKSKLFPTDLGTVVTDFLAEHFKRVMDYGFTAKIEQEFDDVAHGKTEWNHMIDDFYRPFHETVEHTMESAGRIKGERVLGTDQETQKPVVARLGRFGPMVQIGSTEDEEKPRFAKLRAGQSIETITYEEAMDLFKLPLTLGVYQDQEVSVNSGRFGPYVKWGEKFVSLAKGEDPMLVDMDRAISLIQEKEAADAPISIYEGKPVTKGTGRFGPFLKWGDLYINVPRAYNFENLSASDVAELISKKVEKESNRFIKQWEGEKIAIENGRWGPFIRFGKQMLKLDRKPDGTKPTVEDAASLTLEEVKKMVVEQVPGAFEKKAAKSPARKSAPKKAPAKKAASSKATAPARTIRRKS
jgi:DNA topoisomerase-1